MHAWISGSILLLIIHSQKPATFSSQAFWQSTWGQQSMWHVFHWCTTAMTPAFFPKLPKLHQLAYATMSTHLFSHPKVEQVGSCTCGIPNGIPVDQFKSHWHDLFFHCAMELESAGSGKCIPYSINLSLRLEETF